MSARRILVTPRSVTQHGHPSLDRLRGAGYEVVLGPAGRQPTPAELRQLLPGCVAYLAGVEPVGADALAAAAGLRIISRNGTGVDNIDGAAAAARGIAVLRADGANARGVAELTLGLIFSLARRLPATDAALKRGEWTRQPGLELERRTLGLIGCGRIGQMVAKAAGALGMQVIAHDPVVEDKFNPGGFLRYASLDTTIHHADILSLHCPPPPDGKPLLNTTRLASVKRGVLIVNTARSDLIDPAAMLAALETGAVGGLALDVFDEEPPRDLTLVCHPRVIATAHIGGFTQESINRAMDVAVDNLLLALDGV